MLSCLFLRNTNKHINKIRVNTINKILDPKHTIEAVIQLPNTSTGLIFVAKKLTKLIIKKIPITNSVPKNRMTPMIVYKVFFLLNASTVIYLASLSFLMDPWIFKIISIANIHHMSIQYTN